MISDYNNNNNENDNIAFRVLQRRRIWLHQDPTLVSSNRRRLLVKKAGKSAHSFRDLQHQHRRRHFNLFGRGKSEYTRAENIALLKEKLGEYQHHGTGNPLIARSPTTPKGYAVRTLADILNQGILGQTTMAEESSSSSTKCILKTERGKSGSFWTTRLSVAGSYGWTGIILPRDADTSRPFPIANALWILVEDHDEYRLLESLVDDNRWNKLNDRILTISTLAKRL